MHNNVTQISFKLELVEIACLYWLHGFDRLEDEFMPLSFKSLFLNLT